MDVGLDLYALAKGGETAANHAAAARTVDFSQVHPWDNYVGAFRNPFAKPSSAGRMQKEVERGQAPKSVDRVDKGNPGDPGDREPHIEFKDGYTLKQGGTWKHDQAGRALTKVEAEWVKQHNWTLPNQP